MVFYLIYNHFFCIIEFSTIGNILHIYPLKNSVNLLTHFKLTLLRLLFSIHSKFFENFLRCKLKRILNTGLLCCFFRCGVKRIFFMHLTFQIGLSPRAINSVKVYDEALSDCWPGVSRDPWWSCSHRDAHEPAWRLAHIDVMPPVAPGRWAVTAWLHASLSGVNFIPMHIIFSLSQQLRTVG